MRQKILITSALPYANGPLHFGHIAGAYLPGDCYARFQRLRGHEVLYLCGSDEHGVAITLSAEMAHRSPKEHVDLFHEINQKFFHQLSFSFDHYSRTTWPGHTKTTQDFFQVLQRKNLIEEKTENHLFSEKENRFLADRYVIGTCPKCGFQEARGDECQRCASSYEATDLKNPRSKISGAPLVLRPSLHLYMRFDLFKDQLKEWLLSKKWKENVVRFAFSYVDDLKPRAITRDSDWGIPVPGYPGKVFYVWFDAPIGYISAAQEWAQSINQPQRWKDYWLSSDTKLVQFIGKDNIPFHAVFFPAMLMGQDLPYKLPDELPANEFYLLEGRQFSKSDGWYIDLADFFTHYSADQIRYAIAANAPETADSEFTWKDFQMRCNAELLGKLGNFVHRTLTFARQQCAGKVPQLRSLSEDDEKFLEQIDVLTEMAALCFEQFHLRKACQTLMELAQTANVYFDAKKPWILAKDPALRPELEACIAACLHCIKALALIASPLIPESAQKIWAMLGQTSILSKESWSHVQAMTLTPGQMIAEPHVLFRKIEDEEIDRQIEKLGKAAQPKQEIFMTPESIAYEPLKPAITYDQFQAMDLRVGLVLEAIKVPKSKKLLRLLVDLGFEKRTIVSGIALSCELEQLLGKKIIVVANMAPATIMGIESQGMILAAGDDPQLELPQIQHLPPGSCVS
ncbi:MAG: metG [Parachlamydiales bacterium]|nr:metG [Parachlamydiales bacterium]